MFVYIHIATNSISISISLSLYLSLSIYIYIYTHINITPNLPTNIARLKLSRKCPMDMRIPALRIKIVLEANPLKSNVSREIGRTVGFHNFNLRIFDLSLKSEQINCGCFFDTMPDFNVFGSRLKKHDEISEIDRIDLQFFC